MYIYIYTYIYTYHRAGEGGVFEHGDGAREQLAAQRYTGECACGNGGFMRKESWKQIRSDEGKPIRLELSGE
jgi:hypothetical protein